MDKESLLHQICGKDLWLKVWITFDKDLVEISHGYGYIRVIDYQIGNPEWFDCNYLSEYLVELEYAPESIDWNRLMQEVYSIPDYGIEIDDGEICTTEELMEAIDLGYWEYGE
jgi:hypothetical protein